MTQKVATGFHDPRDSSEVNDHFVGVLRSGPYNGFNVVAVPGTSRVQIINNDDGGDNTLVTPEGVTVNESATLVATLDLGAGATTTNIIARYIHGTVGAVCTYGPLTTPLLQPYDTVLASIVKGVGNITDDMIEEAARVRFQGRTQPISSSYGLECVKGIQPVCIGSAGNYAAFPSGHGISWPDGVKTQYEFDLFVPDHHSQAIDNIATPRDFTVLFWLYVSYPGINRTAVFDLDFFEAAPGSAYLTTSTLTLQTTADLSGAAARLCFGIEFASVVAMSTDRLWHMKVSRRGDLVSDDYLGTVDLIGGVFRYARHKVGDAYLAFPP